MCELKAHEKISDWTQWKFQNYHLKSEIWISPLLVAKPSVFRSDGKKILGNLFCWTDRGKNKSFQELIVFTSMAFVRSLSSFESDLQPIFFSRFSFSWCKTQVAHFFETKRRKNSKHKTCLKENNFVSQSWTNIKSDQVCTRDAVKKFVPQSERREEVKKYLFWPV